MFKKLIVGFISILLSSLYILTPTIAAPEEIQNFGWRRDPQEVERILKTLPYPTYESCAKHLTGSGEGKTVLLSDSVKKVLGKHMPAQQQPRGTCFPRGTKITMWDDTFKNIEDVEIGDIIHSNARNVRRVIAKQRRLYTGFLYKIKGHNYSVTATGEHPICIGKYLNRILINRWVEARDLEVGSTFYYYTKGVRGFTDIIEEISLVEVRNFPVYNLEVEVDHTYIANGIYVHNCVSRGWSRAIDYLECVQIVNSAPEKFNLVSHAFVYGTCREIGNDLSRQDGAVGAWAAKAVSTIGVITNEDCGDRDAGYDDLAVEWGWKGVPAKYKDMARERKNIVKTVTLVTSAEQARDMICNGYPISVCSGQGFSMTRNSEGFCRPQGSWAHCVLPDSLISGPIYKKAKDIKIGDMVYSHDGRQHRVSKVYIREHEGTNIRIKAAGIPEIEITDEHPILVYRRVFKVEGEKHAKLIVGDYIEKGDPEPFYTSEGRYQQLWVKAKDILSDDRVLNPVLKLASAKSSYVNEFTMYVVKNIEKANYKGTVYNYEVEDSHSYVANGIITHNCMMFSAYRDDKKWFLVEQSWGQNTPSGPLGDMDIPDNSFWIDWDTANRMLKQQDSFSLSGFNGFPGPGPVPPIPPVPPVPPIPIKLDWFI